MTTNKSNASPTKGSHQRNASNNAKHSTLMYFSDSLFRNKRLKQKRLKWALTIGKRNKGSRKINNNNNIRGVKTEYPRQYKRHTLPALPPELTINLLSDDEDEISHNHILEKPALSPKPQQPQSLPQLVVFPANMQLSSIPNITLVPVQAMRLEIAASLQNRLKHKRKSQKPKRHAEPTLINNESILLSDDSNPANTDETPAACSTPNHLGTPLFSNHQEDSAQLKICSVHSASLTPRIAQVDEEVTVSLVPRCSTTGSCSSKTSTSAELFPMVPDETTVQTTIANRTYELSLSKLREGLASSGVGEYNENPNSPQPASTSTRGKSTCYNLPPKLSQTSPPPVSLKLSSDLSISLISDDEDDPEQQRLNAEKMLRQQPHLSVRPVGVAPTREPPKRRKLG